MNSNTLSDADEGLYDVEMALLRKQHAPLIAALTRHAAEEKRLLEPLARVVLDNELREMVDEY